jgi:hypothetical protein
MSIPFNLISYQKMLESALNNQYKFLSFDEKNAEGNNKFCLLRHDIDADLKAAYEMAAVEKELGIRSTYFLMLRSPVYNLFGRANHDYTEKIISLGHSIGLHYDEGFYPANNKNLQDLVQTEALILSKMFNISISTVSFHQPGKSVQENKIKLKGFINTYDKEDMRGIFYLSDSNMVWKNETPFEIFTESIHHKVQLLIHPMWWVGNGGENTETLWDKAILDNIKRSLSQITRTERAFGSERTIEVRKNSREQI